MDDAASVTAHATAAPTGRSSALGGLRLTSRAPDSLQEQDARRDPASEQKQPSKAGLLLATLGFGLLTLICLLTTLLVVSGSRGRPFPWGFLFGGLFVTAVGISITTQFLIAWRSGPCPGVCDNCKRRGPTIAGGINRHIGVIVIGFHKAVRGHLCRQCISDVYWKYTIVTFLFGWWGAYSCVFTPIILLNNSVVYARSLMMRARN